MTRITTTDKNSRALLKNIDGGIETIPQSYTTSNGTIYRYPGWDTVRAVLNPYLETNTFGRDSFYFHDSHKGFSHGCIEVEYGLFKLLGVYRNYQDKIDVNVDYPSQNSDTNGGTKY